MAGASGRIAVVGAGVSGLAAAWRACRAGAEITVFEAADRWGGVVRSDRRGEWLVERGPHTLQLRPEARELVTSLGLTPVIAAGGRRLKRYIARGSRLVPLPAGPRGLIFGGFFRWQTKTRILRRMLGKSPPPERDLSFADFVRRNFGDEVLTLAAQPFVSGIYAGDPEQLSTQYAFPRLWRALQSGSLLRGQAAFPLASFPGGLGDLPDALVRALPDGALQLDAPVHGLSRDGEGWLVHCNADRPVEAASRRFDRILLTLPAHTAARLRIGGAEPLRFLADIPHPPVTVLTLGFPRAAVRHPLDGFGCLVPAAEKRSILGIIFTSSLFPHRAPAGHVAFTVMLGGTLQPLLAKPTPAEAWAAAQPDVCELLGATGEPTFLEATRYAAAIPQYTLGHAPVLAAIADFQSRHPGVILDGSYRHGIALPDCLATALSPD